jgi:hypothetical protein
MKIKNVYTDLNDLPAFNWFRCTKTQDLTFLLVDRKKKADKELLEEVFQKLNDQLINELGVSDEYLNYLHKLRSYNLAKCQYLISQNNFDLTLMNIAKTELEQIQKQMSSGAKSGNEKISAERILGFRIDLKDISVIEYYDYIKEADKIARSLSAKK